ncbi:efflux RND transporter periplasmic adaptor subunit [Sporohalobacter salinus]|uniref:efflux RND transporter periplasmic adaptor subunit n=1 Tax=Sporohalobacter salinus TaxID=1494606 RepID=UPI00195FCF2B|nr:efflux RND transporter periplasmic adaptor subunit [Sporohalobacter salinus]MBM7624514.1 multidrug resistance efflux pump [Sporohalobacter salinus]
MNKAYKKVIIIGLIIGLILGAVAGCGFKDEQGSKKDRGQNQSNNGIPVETISVQKGKIINYITVTGTAEAVQSAQLTPQLQKTVKKVLVESGDRVHAGEKLIQLDQEDIKAKINEARAGLETAKAGLEELLAGTRGEEINRLKAQVKQAKANYHQAERDYQRYKKLFDKDAISRQQFESAKTKYISAKNNYESLQESLKMAQKGPTKEQIKTQWTKVQQARAQLETAQLNLDKTKITAPFNGLVAEVNTEEGEMVSTQPIVTILNLNSIEIQTYVSEKNINKLDIGQQVEVNFNALDNNLKGRIKNISPALNQKEQGFPVKIKVNNNENLIKSGMYAEIKMKTDQRSGNLVILKQSLLRENGSEYIFGIENNRAVKKKVKTGLTTTTRVEVMSGIKAGEKIITKGAEQVTDGYKVRVIGGGDQ